MVPVSLLFRALAVTTQLVLTRPSDVLQTYIPTYNLFHETPNVVVTVRTVVVLIPYICWLQSIRLPALLLILDSRAHTLLYKLVVIVGTTRLWHSVLNVRRKLIRALKAWQLQPLSKPNMRLVGPQEQLLNLDNIIGPLVVPR